MLSTNIHTLALADPCFDKPAPVELLLGADIFSQVLNGKRVIVDKDLPTAFGSSLGWKLVGAIPGVEPTSFQAQLVSLTVSLEEIIDRFWKLEEPEAAPDSFNDEGHCESIFKTEYSRLPSCRFMVPLPFRRNVSDEQLFGSRQLALRRIENLESDLSLQNVYSEFMSEYIFLGHKPVTTNPGVYYIPHHAVFKSGDIRVVFDALAQSACESSLNSQLYTGPKLQQDIIDILLRFRVHRHVFTSDICKMYRQILVDPKYTKYQHIFWCKSPFDELLEYQLTTVTYGVNCAPYLALRVLKELADSECHSMPTVQNEKQINKNVNKK